MPQSKFTELCSSAAVVSQSKSTELCSSAVVVPQSKSTELCSSAAVVPQSKSTELCSSAAVVPQSKSTELCIARRRHWIMTCDTFGTGQTNTLTLCYLLVKTHKPAHSSPHSRVTKINTLDQITGKVIDVSRTHIPLKALTGLVRSLNSDVKAFKTVNSM